VYAASSPDYEEGFEARQLSYVELGLLAMVLAEKLKVYANLPAFETIENLNPKYVFN